MLLPRSNWKLPTTPDSGYDLAVASRPSLWSVASADRCIRGCLLSGYQGTLIWSVVLYHAHDARARLLLLLCVCRYCMIRLASVTLATSAP